MLISIEVKDAKKAAAILALAGLGKAAAKKKKKAAEEEEEEEDEETEDEETEEEDEEAEDEETEEEDSDEETEDDEESEDEDEEEEKPKRGRPKGSSKGALTLEKDILPAFNAYAKKHSRPKALLILKKFKVKAARELPKAKWPAVLKLLKK